MTGEAKTLQPRGLSSGLNSKDEGEEHKAIEAAFLFKGKDEEKELGLGFKTENDSNIAVIVESGPFRLPREIEKAAETKMEATMTRAFWRPRGLIYFFPPIKEALSGTS